MYITKQYSKVKLITRKVRRFTLVELLVVIAIISILAALLLPTLQSAIQQANTITCQNQLRQWGFSMQSYSEDYNSYYPTAKFYHDDTKTWFEQPLYFPYIGVSSKLDSQRLYTCPNWGGVLNSSKIATSYCLWYPDTTGNYYAPKTSFTNRPSQLVLLFDGRAQSSSAGYCWLQGGNSAWVWPVSFRNGLTDKIRLSTSYESWANGYRHPGDRASALFYDLHVDGIDEIQTKNEDKYSVPDRSMS